MLAFSSRTRRILDLEARISFKDMCITPRRSQVFLVNPLVCNPSNMRDIFNREDFEEVFERISPWGQV
jgi:hypothetical protein